MCSRTQSQESLESDSDFHNLGSYRSSNVPGVKTVVTFVDARPASRCPVIVVGESPGGVCSHVFRGIDYVFSPLGS